MELHQDHLITIIIIISQLDIDLESGSPTRGGLTLVDSGLEVKVMDYILIAVMPRLVVLMDSHADHVLLSQS